MTHTHIKFSLVPDKGYVVSPEYSVMGRLMCCSGKIGALEETHEISSACHKRFKTKAQAEVFIDDWKESFADVWRREVKNALDWGFRPRDMKLSIEGILHEGTEDFAKQFYNVPP